MFKRGVILICIFFLFSGFVNGAMDDSSVFVTDIYGIGDNINSIADAHKLCRQEASTRWEISQESVLGWWKAWVSTEEIEAKDFIEHSLSRWCYPDSETARLVANNWDELTSEYGIENGIDCLVDGGILENPYYPFVHTGTKNNGSFNDYNCDDFSNLYGEIRGGGVGSAPYWTSNHYVGDETTDCSTLGRLYCFRQTFDGDADSIDCGISHGVWVGRSAVCASENCDTFHDWDGYSDGFCCGDDDDEYHMYPPEGEYVHGCCIEEDAKFCDGICQTGNEGLNYVGSCSDDLDNDCDNYMDEGDADCQANIRLRLMATNPRNVCDGDSGSYTISLDKLSGNINWDSVIVYDQVYNSGGGLEHTESVSCVVDGLNYANNRCSKSYSLSLDVGEGYYHNIYAEASLVEIIRHNNYGSFTILDNENDLCCKDWSKELGEGDVCCEGMPDDYGTIDSGFCGCPTDFEWESGECRYIGALCPSTCTIQELFNDPEHCFFPLSLPHYDVCCFDVGYNDQNYYEWTTIEVY